VPQSQGLTEQTDQGYILLADDDAILLTLHKEILESLGYKVITASHGMEAIEQYKKHQNAISLAVFDVMMPFMNGPDAATCIARLDASLPFIFVTGCDAHEDLKILSLPQGFQVLSKPLNFEYFIALVHDLLATSTTAQA